jgi:MFS family permease
LILSLEGSPITSRRASWIIAFASFISYAYVVTSIGPVLPRLSQDFALSPTWIGIITGLYSAGGFMAILGGWLSDRLSRVLISILSMMMLTVGALLLGFSPDPFMAGSSLFLMGVAAGFLESALNALVSDLYSEKRGLSLNLFHIGWNVGSGFGPFLAALVIVAFGSWRKVYLFPLPVLVFFAVLLTRLKKNEPKSQIKTVLKSPLANSDKSVSKSLPIASMAFLYTGAEMGISTWLAYILENLGSATIEAGLTTGLFWGLMGLGRLVWSPAVDRIGYSKTIVIASALTLPCMIVAAMPLPLNVCMFLWAASGFLLAPIFPTVIAWGTSMNPLAGSTISGLIMTLGTLGLFSSTFLAGLIATYFGAREAQYVFVCFTATLLVDALIMWIYFKKN